MRIDRIEKRPRTRKIDVYAGGAVVLTLTPETAQDAALRVGDTLTPAGLARLRFDDDRRRALRASLQLIALRPRSERELRDTLRRKGFGQALVDQALARLRDMGYVDDPAFAEFWTETRQAAAPRSRRMLRWELATKGIDPSVAGEAVAAIDDDVAAYDAAVRRARSLDRVDEAAFRRRLTGFLQRRGFGWDAARRAVDRCWADDAPAPL